MEYQAVALWVPQFSVEILEDVRKDNVWCPNIAGGK